MSGEIKVLGKIGSLEIHGMPEDKISKVRNFKSEVEKLPQIELETIHTFHAGMYARTLMMPAGVMMTGALIKIATILIIAGEGIVYTSDGAKEYSGYNVVSGMAGRKQAFLARTDTYMTMLFPTKSSTIAEAEAEFTDETHLLLTNRERA